MKKEVFWFPAILLLAVAAAWVVYSRSTKFGLDINGGLRAVLQAEVKPGMTYDQDTVLHVLENRLNSSGVAEPQIIEKGQYQFIVELPNVLNKDQIIQQLQTTAQMQMVWFRDVASQHNAGARYKESIGKDASGRDQYSFTDQSDPTGRTSFRDQAQIVADFQKRVLGNSLPHTGAAVATIPAPLNAYAPANQPLYLDPAEKTIVQSLNQELINWNAFYSMELQASGALTNGPPGPVVSGADVKPNASASIDSSKGAPEPVVNVQFTDKGTQEFGDFTREHVNDLLAIVLDGRVLSAPNIDEPILDGNCEISGGFASLEEAQSLANYLNAGALPVPLSMQEDETVEATLGHSAVQHMVTAGLIGLGLVLAFMALYYLVPGLVADIALIFYALFALAIFKGGLDWFIPAVTLTLPGIAGFILSFGMAVDANILIFERLKEELRNGKALRPAIDAGFKRAFTAIRDSNICTLITCVILFSMGTESVKGFALTLGIGVCVSLFTAITATRSMLYLLVDLGLGKYPALFGLKRQWVTGSHAAESGPGYVPVAGRAASGVNVIRNRRIYYTISLAIIIPGIVFWFMGGLKRSIEFKGGTQVVAVFNAPVTQDTVRNAVKVAGYLDNLVQMGTAPSGEPIAIVSVTDRSTTAYQGVEAALTKAGLSYKLQSHSLVGGIISKELTTNAFEAVIIAAALIVFYMAFAFAIGGFVAGLRFGTSAIVALMHDVLVLIGSFAILGYFLDWQIDSLFVTATLTVVGFSVHDTIVIFDRLRENLRHRLKSDTFEDLANRSILQSFARSINTSFTVVLTLCAMLIFGEPSTRLLIVALLIGIVSGTYSSIFNATPILVDWENWLSRRSGRVGSRADMMSANLSTPAPAAATGSSGFSNSGGSASADAASGKTVEAGQTLAPGRPGVTRSKKKSARRF